MPSVEAPTSTIVDAAMESGRHWGFLHIGYLVSLSNNFLVESQLIRLVIDDLAQGFVREGCSCCLVQRDEFTFSVLSPTVVFLLLPFLCSPAWRDMRPTNDFVRRLERTQTTPVQCRKLLQLGGHSRLQLVSASPKA